MIQKKNINIFFDELKLNAGTIWLEDENIKFSIPASIQNQELNDFIESNKSQIISILNENHIFSKKKFLETVILKDNSILSEEILKKQLEYWRTKLSGCPNLELPVDYARSDKTDFRNISREFALDEVISQKLRVLANKCNTSLNSLMLSSFGILLGKYTSQSDIVIGGSITNRQNPQTEGAIGRFANKVAHRMQLDAKQSFESLIKQVHQDQLEAQLNEDLPFERLVEDLGVHRDALRHPIFQIMFSVNGSAKELKQKKHLDAAQRGEDYNTAGFDLSIILDDSREEITGRVQYAAGLFKKETIERFIAHYLHLLGQLAESSKKTYSEISLLDPKEYKKIVSQWNETSNDFPKEKTIHQLFQEQAKKTPEGVALVYGQQELTYKELNEKSNQLARHIRTQYQQRTNQPLNADTPIALFLDRNLEMLIGILAVLKAGGAYVPIDITYPQDRVDYILKDTQAEIVLGQKYLNAENQAQLPQEKVVCIDLDEKLYEEEDSSNLSLHGSGNDLAYVIYTSGTTGKPKGVMIEHRAVLSLVCNDYVQVSKNDVFAFLSSPTFDAATFEIWTPLLKGNQLIIPNDVKNLASDTKRFSEFLSANKISVLWLTKTLFESLYYLDSSLFQYLNYLIIGGEALDRNTVNKLIESGTKPNNFLNGYGPTESTTFTCIYNLKNSIEGYNVPIGKPINNRSTYILDQNRQPVPIGVVGELYIGGAGLARGYLKNPELTEARFVPNPFATGTDIENGYTRLYRTGDLVRWLSDGNIEFIGRNDDQVKIRGYRIELGEIEHALTQISGIKQGCVLAKERKTDAGISKYLVAYYVQENSESLLTQETILDRLSHLLPEYMVPNALVKMESFPLTINGKLDKYALPDPTFSSSTDEYTAPATDTEMQICKIWQKVLGIDRVGVTDEFFRIGGNSILAIQASHQMSKALEFDIQVADVFRYKTILQLLFHCKGKTQISIPQIEGDEAILSFAQDRLWFIEQYEEGTNAYHIPAVYELNTGIDIEGIKFAIRKVVSRHEVLRSTIESRNGQGIQVVHDAPLIIDEITLSDNEDYETHIRADINRPFNLGSDYPIRVKLYKTQSDDPNQGNLKGKTLLLINTHHIATDGWSVDIFQKELIEFYKAYVSHNFDFCLPALEIQYKDYAVWQRIYLSGEVFDNQLGYWKSRLSGCQTLELPIDFQRPNRVDYKGAYLRFNFDRQVSNKLRILALQNGTTLHSVMLSGLSILLSKYTGQDDIVIGSPTANRHHKQTEELIGFFVNMQANRILLNPDQNYESLIKEVHQGQEEAQLHQDLPFERLVEGLGVTRDTSRHPIFQVMFSVQDFSNQGKVFDQQKGYLTPVEIESAYEVEQFDLSIFIDDDQEEFAGQISYATSLFHQSTIERLIEHYKYLFTQLVDSPKIPYSQISLLSPDEYNQIIYHWNETSKDYPKEKTIHQLFQEQVLKTPTAIAVEYDGQRLTYQELNDKSNQLAWFIREQYQQKTGCSFALNSLIALYLDRCLEAIIGMLAIMKAGGAYVPMDTNYPQERVDYILKDTQAKLVLCKKHVIKGGQNELPKDKVIYIDLTGDIFSRGDISNLPPHSKSGDLAYVIYTSGTTGRPKGVELTHRGLCNLAFTQKNALEINPESKMLQYASLVFDASVWEIFSTLPFGAELSIVPAPIRQDPYLLCDYLANLRITTTLLPPVLLSAMPYTHLPDLKTLLVGGDLSAQETMDKWSRGRKLINAYGPTEGTVISTMHLFAEGDSNTNIGKPIDNTKVFVLDNNFIPVPVGIIGELYIGGVGLAKGYLKRPDLTEERFVLNPFANETDRENDYVRLYRTGDLVKWLPDGNLEFIGRNDGQVKIRGFRIELGEVEHAIAQISGVKQSCVLVKERKTESGDNKYLVGYYVLDEGGDTLTQSFILSKLSQVLPEYMIPSVLVPMVSFPLNLNGKLDKHLLPDPDFSLPVEEYVAPVTDTEKELCTVWREVLGLEKVGVTDDFFRVGGNSILAIQVSHRMSKALNRDVKVADIFRYKTVSQLLLHSDVQTQESIPRIAVSESILSFAQDRLWFIEQYEQGTNAYHIPSVFELDGSTDIDGLKYALQQIVLRHEVLRSTIEQHDGHGVQVVHDEPLAIEEIVLSDKEDHWQFVRNDINRPFNLGVDYPIRIKFYIIQSDKDTEGNPLNRTLLLINIHHIASDGWSMDIFQKELFAYYKAYINNNIDFNLPVLEIQYKDYAAWQKNYLTGETLEKQLNYWKTKLSGFQILELPIDYTRPNKIDYRGAYQAFAFDKLTSQRLRILTQRHGTTLHSVMLSGLSILLSKYTGQDDIVVGSPMTNRHHRQTEELIGFFVNTQANRFLLSAMQNFEALTRQTHQSQVEAQHYQDLPFEKLVEELGVDRDTSRHPIFQVMFSVQSFTNQSITSEQQKNYLRPFQVESVYEIEKFDLSIFIDDSKEELTGQISYATSLFRKDSIERFIAYYKYLLAQLTEAPERPYSQFSLLNSDEYNQIVYQWNKTSRDYPKNKTISQLFQEQVERTPNGIALIYNQKRLTYKELNERSNQLARHIRIKCKERMGQSIAEDTLIALYLDRSLEMIVGILAVLKAGGAYVPMDPTYPQERVDYILADTQAELVLSQKHLVNDSHTQLPSEKVILIDLTEALYEAEDLSNLPQHSRAEDLAYIIYTSGTTGKPKGVMVEHHQVASFSIGNNYIGYDKVNVVAGISNYAFDGSVFDIFFTLLNGKELVLIDSDNLLDLSKLDNQLVGYNVDTIFITTALFNALVQNEAKCLNSLTQVLFGGEACNIEMVNRFKRLYGKSSLVHVYGPTENIVYSTYCGLSDYDTRHVVPIGSNLSDKKLYVLDKHLAPVPVGVVGELYIGGVGVARGYLKRPELTEERFIPNPFALEADRVNGNTRLYKTGDLVRWLPDGNIEFIGRNDDQVKIRGFRIELGEVEHAITQISGIKQSCVLAKERKTEAGSGKYLVAYYVLDGSDDTLNQTVILNKLSQELPEYMLPSALVAMESLPLNINGKLDKRALPDPDFSLLTDGYVAPTTEVEIELCKVWQEVLGLDRIGTTDDFFRVGGNSILAIQVSYRMSKVLGCEVRVADVFKCRSIKVLLSSVSLLQVDEENISWKF